MTPALNSEQSAAVAAIETFLQSNDEFFLLKGAAGTGKTFCIKELIPRIRGRLVFTAPTNKATKVLRESVASEDYKPDCRTIYSLLGLRLEANGEIKELTAPEDPLDLTKFVAVIVDEASMINAQLFAFIKSTAEQQCVKFIFMGDAAQLPPVKETASPVWAIEQVATLDTVMRHDNQILTLATTIRKLQSHPAPNLKFTRDNDGAEGVWVCKDSKLFLDKIEVAARAGEFSRPNVAKAIAWRNITVDTLNAFIRSKIFDNAHTSKWLPTDRLIMTEPVATADKERRSVTTDDEGTVERVEVTYHPIYGEFKCYKLVVQFDDNKLETIWALHEDSTMLFAGEKERRAAAARENRRLWPKFWEFLEAFHQCRHAYAITAHRSQGSTYTTTFVDWRDIFANRNRGEAMRCLYVACTRPKKQLVLS